MPDDPEISLRQYIERIIDERQESHRREHEFLTNAQEKYSEVISARLEMLNHIREEQARADSKFVSVDKWEIGHKSIEKEIRGLSKIVYMGLGAVVFLQVVAEWVLRAK